MSNLKLLLYSTAPFRRVYHGPLPLSHHASLTWIGFTKEGCVATYDSGCVIRVLTSLSLSSEEVMMDDKEWVVLMNVKHVMREKHGQSESCESESTPSFIVPYCWLVALSMQSLKFVLLPSAAAVPPTLPRPFLSVMDIDMPLCVHHHSHHHSQAKHAATTQFEKTLLLQSYELSSLSETAPIERSELIGFDKMLLRQLNTEIGSNQLLRAEYLCSLLNTTAALKKAAIVWDGEWREG